MMRSDAFLCYTTSSLSAFNKSWHMVRDDITSVDRCCTCRKRLRVSAGKLCAVAHWAHAYVVRQYFICIYRKIQSACIELSKFVECPTIHFCFFYWHERRARNSIRSIISMLLYSCIQSNLIGLLDNLIMWTVSCDLKVNFLPHGDSFPLFDFLISCQASCLPCKSKAGDCAGIYRDSCPYWIFLITTIKIVWPQ